MLAEYISDVLAATPSAFKRLVEHIDPEWIMRALAARTEGADVKVRRRKLPIEAVLWLVIGMALFRDRSIAEVARHLELVIDEQKISPGALPAGRWRLGSGPLEVLFELSAAAWSEPEAAEGRWQGLSLWALDGTCFNVPNSVENEAVYDRPANGTSFGPFPQVRLVALMRLHNHMLAAINMDSSSVGEMTLARPLWDLLPDHSLTVVDRGLQSWWLLYALTLSGADRHWLTRARKTLACKVVERLGPGDELVRVTLPHNSPDRIPGSDAKDMVIRRIRFSRRGYKTIYLITSLCDPKKFPASELGAQYCRRWEIEMGYDELKTHLLEKQDLRSKTAEGVRQELFGAAIAYNLVRRELARVAAELKVDPLRMSFRHGLMMIRNFLVSVWATSPGAVPKRLEALERDLSLLVLPERRARRCKREVIRRRSKYSLRKPLRRRPRAK